MLTAVATEIPQPLIIFQGFKLQFKNIKSRKNETSKFYYLSRFIDYVHLVLKSIDIILLIVKSKSVDPVLMKK